MAWFDFVWTEDIVAHLVRHNVTRDEFEHVVSYPSRESKSRTSERDIADGYTKEGRYLRCVFELLEDGITVIPVTAYDYRS